MARDIVLCDDLFKLLFKFKKGQITQRQDLKNVESLLCFLKPYLANKRQYDLIQEEVPTEMRQQLLASGCSDNMSELELAKKKTRFKIILTNNNKLTKFPYLCINGSDKIELNYTGTFKKCPRLKCIEHIRALCSNAHEIRVYDKYLCSNENFSNGIFEKFLGLFQNIHSEINLIIELPHHKRYSEQYTALTSWWKANSINYGNIKLTYPQASDDFHDRYMIIKSSVGNVEVLLSSGFFHLFNFAKDFTYLIHSI